MTDDQRVELHIARMERLFDRYPGRFCWVELALLAVYGPREGPKGLHQAAARAGECVQSASRDGECYCGAYRAWEEECRA